MKDDEKEIVEDLIRGLKQDLEEAAKIDHHYKGIKTKQAVEEWILAAFTAGQISRERYWN